MDREYGMNGGKEKCIHGFSVNSRRKETKDVGRRIILRWILER
jgi:hypothetical protein